MTSLSEAVKKWLLQKPVEPSVMEPIPSRARLASDTEEDRRARAEILGAIGMLPIPYVGDAAQVASGLAGESELTPLGVAKAVAGAIMPVRAGRSKINVMGEASKVDPDVLLRIRKALLHGVPAAKAYAEEAALPLVRNGKVEDAWVPVMPKLAALNPPVKKAFEELRADENLLQNPPGSYIKTTFGNLYAPQELTKLAKHYPQVLDVPVKLKAEDLGGSGFLDSSGIEINAFPTYGPRGVSAIGAHEGTHALQAIADLPQGYNSEAAREALGKLRARFIDTAIGSHDPRADELARRVIKGDLVIPPGTERLPAPYEGVDPYIKRLARSYAWAKRLEGASDENTYRLYKAHHGEQAAEGARQWNVAETPHFTTPLSKQIFNPGDLAWPSYAQRLQDLYALKQSSLFDPLARPYELP